MQKLAHNIYKNCDKRGAKMKHTKQKINLILGIAVLTAVLLGMAYYFSGMEDSVTLTHGTLI